MTKPNLIILYVEDPLASVKFYQEMLGEQPAYEGPTFASISMGGGFMLGLWKLSSVRPAAAEGASRSEIAFMVEGDGAVESQYRAWKSRGLPIAQELVTLDFGPTFVVLDPDGHRLRVCETDK